jgi:hypothetical protein
MELSSLTFHRQFSRFDKKIRLQSNGRSFTSFREGLPAQWEEDLRKEALYRLDIRTWKKKEIGKGSILKRVISAIEIHEPRRHIRNNLVAWQNRYGHKHRSHRRILDARSNPEARYDLEKWFFDFFKGRPNEEQAFETFRRLAGNRYDIVAYLFFLKDWHRFMPIAPSTFDKALRLFNFDLVTSGRCSWQNYTSYNKSLLSVQQALRDIEGVLDARLVDAHSFCWMLIRLKLPAPPSDTVIPLPVAVKTLDAVATIHELDITDEIHFNAVDEEEFLKKQARNRQLGKLAPEIALQSERKRLTKIGHPNPEVVKPVWDELKRGYDILSYELKGDTRPIEVKAARKSGKRISFFLTAYEWRRSRRVRNYHFYLVLNARTSKPAVLMIKASQMRQQYLIPANFLSTFAVNI